MAHLIPLTQVFRQTTPMSCWFYAAKTIVFYRRGRLLIEANYRDVTVTVPRPLRYGERVTGRGSPAASWFTSGLPAHMYPQFCAMFGFERPPERDSAWTSQRLESMLRNFGPLYFSCGFGDINHAVVVSGIDEGQYVHFGDPAIGEMHAITLDEFNAWKRQIQELTPGHICDFWNPLYCLIHPDGQRPVGRFYCL